MSHLKESSSIGNIALIFNHDDVINPSILAEFLRETKYKISALYEFPPFTNPEMLKTYHRVLMSIFSKKFIFQYGLKTLRNKFYTSLKLNHGFYSVAAVSEYFEIPYFKFHSVNSENFRQELRQRKIKTALSLTSQIYKDKTLNVTDLKIYNFHPANLPYNKGLFPIFWVIMKDKKHVMTCHQIIRKIDEGPIVFQRDIPSTSKPTVESVMETLFEQCVSYFEEALDRVSHQNFMSFKNKGEGSYDPIPDKKDLQAYKDLLKGLK